MTVPTGTSSHPSDWDGILTDGHTFRTHAILRAMHEGIPKIDYLYVDECQDFLVIDIKRE